MAGRTIRQWIDEEYDEAVAQVHCLLQNAASQVYISFNVWMSDNGYIMVGIYGHFIGGDSSQLQAILLALQRIKGHHSREEVSHILIKVIRF